MRPLARSVVALTVLSLSAASLGAQQRAGRLDGGWRLVHEQVATPDSTFVPTLSNGRLVISGRHYSQIALRPAATGVQQASVPSAIEEKAARYDLVTANAGTIEVRDGQLTFHIEQAKVPQIMGTTSVRPYRLKGDSLWITATRPSMKDSTKTVRTVSTFVRER
jgi:hypothetical protein